MNVASLELCKELYELSGWGATEYKWCHTDDIGDFLLRLDHPKWQPEFYSTEAYDLGYLLRMLPMNYEGFDVTFRPNIDHDNEWEASFWINTTKNVLVFEDNPENALVNLAIGLFKQGILTKGDK